MKFLVAGGWTMSQSVTPCGCWHDNMAWHVAVACMSCLPLSVISPVNAL